MSRHPYLPLLACLLLLLGCGPRDGPVARRLRPLKELHVPIQTESLRSMDRALAEKGIGNVMASDFKPRFQVWEWKRKEGNVQAIGVYTQRAALPRETTATMTMTPGEFLQAALADPDVQGVLFDPGTPKAWFITRGEGQRALASLQGPKPQ